MIIQFCEGELLHTIAVVGLKSPHATQVGSLCSSKLHNFRLVRRIFCGDGGGKGMLFLSWVWIHMGGGTESEVLGILKNSTSVLGAACLGVDILR